MAGLFFWNNSFQIKTDVINNVFSRLDYKEGKYLHMGEWGVLVFPKSSYEIQNWIDYNNGSICGVGTFAYKGKVYEKALPLIYKDVEANQLDYTAFWGSFIILVYVKGCFLVIRDGAGLTRLFGVHDKEIFSTSFAGLIDSNISKYTIDKDAVTELLATGVLTGNATIIKEIKSINIGQQNICIKILETKSQDYSIPKNRNEALEQQIEITRSFIKKVVTDWSNYMSKSIIDVGITGGMDSRLLAALTLDCASNVELHTHWREEQMQNDDYKYAHVIAQDLGLRLNVKEIISTHKMTPDQLKNNFEEAYRLSDGVIRPGCYWDEPYSTTNYRSELVKAPYIRFLGFGGEQYRNGERIPFNSNHSLRNWIKWEMNYQFSGRYFNSKKQLKLIEDRIEYNISSTTGIRVCNLRNYKEYIRLIQSPSYRSLQAQMENRIGFCVNPFLDIQLSAPSLLAVPYLGKSLDFQLNMISLLSEKVAKIPNGYGFNFLKGEPIALKLGAILWQILPPWIKHPLYSCYKKHYRSKYIPNLAEKFEFVSQIEMEVLKLNLPIKFSKYRLVRSRSKLLLNLGYFIKRNEKLLS